MKGGASGLGEAVVRKFVKEGGKVAVSLHHQPSKLVTQNRVLNGLSFLMLPA